jgi:hypothetical protein
MQTCMGWQVGAKRGVMRTMCGLAGGRETRRENSSDEVFDPNSRTVAAPEISSVWL